MKQCSVIQISLSLFLLLSQNSLQYGFWKFRRKIWSPWGWCSLVPLWGSGPACPSLVPGDLVGLWGSSLWLEESRSAFCPQGKSGILWPISVTLALPDGRPSNPAKSSSSLLPEPQSGPSGGITSAHLAGPWVHTLSRRTNHEKPGKTALQGLSPHRGSAETPTQCVSINRLFGRDTGDTGRE